MANDEHARNRINKLNKRFNNLNKRVDALGDLSWFKVIRELAPWGDDLDQRDEKDFLEAENERLKGIIDTISDLYLRQERIIDRYKKSDIR